MTKSKDAAANKMHDISLDQHDHLRFDTVEEALSWASAHLQMQRNPKVDQTRRYTPTKRRPFTLNDIFIAVKTAHAQGRLQENQMRILTVALQTGALPHSDSGRAAFDTAVKEIEPFLKARGVLYGSKPRRTT